MSEVSILKEKKINLLIEADGHVSPSTVGELCSNGADLFVAGSSAIFNNSGPLESNIFRLKSSLYHIWEMLKNDTES